MAEPLTPISGNEQRSRTLHSSSSITTKGYSSSSKQQQSQHVDDSIFPSDIVAPSSPFLYEAERSARSPTKASSPVKSPSKSRSPHKVALNDSRARVPLTEETLRANENNLETPRAAQIKKASSRDFSPSESCLSAFSAIPNADMTMFAKLGLSPAKSPSKRGSQDEPSSPTRSRPNTPGTVRPKHSRDAGRTVSPGDDNTTQLMDFTEQLDFAAQSNRSPTRTRNSPSKDSRDKQYKHQHRMNPSARDQAGFRPVTPSQAREFTNLLDFDLPPAPTPRSIPTITARELESLKAGFLSQISSLKATISGKEAEITALSAAASDAETRVGDALEQLRDTRNIKESLEQEKEDWDKRDKETQRVLREVRTQIHETEDERTQMETRLAEAERRAEDADERAQAAESKVASAAAGVAAVEGDVCEPGSEANKAVQIAVEKVARELHSLYKAKHETKVAQLKKSYESRWMKKTGVLQESIDRLEKELQESRMESEGLRHELEETKLQTGRVDAMTTINPSKLAELEAKEKDLTQLREQVDKLQADLTKAREEKEDVEQRADHFATGAVGDSSKTKQLESTVESLTTELSDVKATSAKLAKELRLTREENSQLVATVDEFLLMDLDAASSAMSAAPSAPDTRPASSHSASLSRPGSAMGARLEATSSKPSGLKGPSKFGFGQSRIGMGGPDLKRSISGSGTRSGILSNIEKMGRQRNMDH